MVKNEHPHIPNGSIWTHHRKLTSYRVLFTGNLYGDDEGDFKYRVLYVDMTGRIWARHPDKFLKKFIRD